MTLEAEIFNYRRIAVFRAFGFSVVAPPIQDALACARRCTCPTAVLLPSSGSSGCAAEPLTTCSPVNVLWRAMRVWLGFVSFQCSLCYVLGRLFGCSVLTEPILAYRGTMSTKIVHKNKIFSTQTMCLIYKELQGNVRGNGSQVARIHKNAAAPDAPVLRALRVVLPDAHPNRMRPSGLYEARQCMHAIPCTLTRVTMIFAPWCRIVLLHHDIILCSVHALFSISLAVHVRDTRARFTVAPRMPTCADVRAIFIVLVLNRALVRGTMRARCLCPVNASTFRNHASMVSRNGTGV